MNDGQLNFGLPMPAEAFIPISEKREIESDPQFWKAEASLLDRYISVLLSINKAHVGVVSFVWPNAPYPLYFRCGSTDINNFIQIFCSHEYGFPINHSPRRILDLGGYVGFAAIYLAIKYPDAEIISVEPSEDNFRVLTMNTAPFANIRRLNAAVWGEVTTLTGLERNAGDWGTSFKAGESTNAVQAYSIEAILNRCGWDSFDFLKCDIEGSEVSVFDKSKELIASNALCCAIELHDAIDPTCSKTVAAAFSSEYFDRSTNGEFDIFIRRHVSDDVFGPPTKQIVKPAIGTRALQRINVPEEAWGFYTFNGDSFQLHPADFGGHAPSTLRAPLQLEGHCVFESDIETTSPFGHAVEFSVTVEQADGVVLAAKTALLAPGERRHWKIPFPPAFGEHVVVCADRMAPGPTSNHQVSARWINPRVS